MAMTESLLALRDVEGVLGSFVIDEQGALVAKDLPAVFYPELFKELGPRLLRLRECVEAAGDEPQLFVFRFSEHKLHVRCMENGVICALSEPKVNLPALKLALTLVARRARGEVMAPPERTAPPPPASLDPAATLPSMTSPFSAPAPSAAPPSVAPPSVAPQSQSASVRGPVSSQRPAPSKRGFYRGRPV